MITKKYWDSLPISTKRGILGVIFGEDFEKYPNRKCLLQEYRHNFDFDDTGKWLKQVLSQCYKNSEHTINVRKVIFIKKGETCRFIAPPQPVKKATPQTTEEKHWQIDYTAKDGDLCHIHCYARSKEDAIDYLYSEYLDVQEVIQVIRLRD